MRSLGRRLLLGTTLGTTLVLATSGAVLYVLIRAGLLEQFDRSLVDKARTLASTVDEEHGRLDLEFEELDMYEFQSADRLGYLQVWAVDGTVLYRSPSLEGADLDLPGGSAREEGAGGSGLEAESRIERTPGPQSLAVVRSCRLPDGRHGRAVSILVTPKAPKASAARVRLVMARDTVRIDALLLRLGILLAVVGLLAVAVSAGVLGLVVRRSLRPVRRLAAQIGQLGQENLSARIDAAGVPSELHVVTARLNDLLGRLEAAFARERAFSCDVAHELRTPLAGLRSTIDVTLSRPRAPQDYQKALGDCLRVTLQMQAMVEKLLKLASLEAGEVRIELEPVVPNELVRAAWEPLRQSAAARRLQVQWNLAAPQVLVTDPSLLDHVIRNVLENAVQHADEGGTVAIETAGGDGRAEIRVRNTGARLSPLEAAHVFERFWRGDAARSGTGIHAGLGLSLVSRTVAALHGRVTVESREDGRFEIAVVIPDAQGLASGHAAPDTLG
jgi:two-component system heavy metal sensor histidine kinase CusS